MPHQGQLDGWDIECKYGRWLIYTVTSEEKRVLLMPGHCQEGNVELDHREIVSRFGLGSSGFEYDPVAGIFYYSSETS